MSTEVGTNTWCSGTVDVWMRVWVDFGCTSDPVLLTTHDVIGLKPGTPVVMYDEDGNTCRGTVSRVGTRRAWLLPDWDTWNPFEP